MTPSRSFYLAMVLFAIAAWTAPSQWRSIQGLADTWWWPATSGSLILVSAIGFRWMERAKDASPMQFVAAVNGTTALKLFTALGWITAFLVTQEGLKKEFTFSTFAVFLLCTVAVAAFGMKMSAKKENNETNG